MGLLTKYGGRGEIRTHGGREPTSVFKTGALNRSATLPETEFYHNVYTLNKIIRQISHREIQRVSYFQYVLDTKLQRDGHTHAELLSHENPQHPYLFHCRIDQNPYS